MSKGELMICKSCGEETHKRSNGPQKYCSSCSNKADKIRKRKWYEQQRGPLKPKEAKVCSICGSEINVWQYKGEHFYCKTHYHEMYNYGEIKDLRGRRKKNEYKIEGNQVKFITTDNQVGTIDLDDIDLLHNHYWGVNSQGYLHSRINGKLVRMHRHIFDYPDETIDHINRNPLDNRKENLRITDYTGNNRNSSISKANKSGVVGVSKIGPRKWVARITVDYKEIKLGHFEDFEDAITARRLAEIEHFGEYAPRWED
ncbi:hypothetical protein [Virgibacillus sp. CBA3643]|uniref:hypothetical protein n=1 Tax=Virgibacillus sp. CBA3643 TaxID=2942278 RepID=UPI0035A3D1DB